MDDAERGVAVADALHQDTERDDVVHLFDATLVRLHLAPNGVQVLGASGDVGGKALFGQATRQRLADLVDVLVAFALRLVNSLRDLGVRVALEVSERQVFEFALERLDAEPVGQRSVDLHGLPGDALLGLGLHVLERAHVVDAVAELDQKHADVPRHGHDHLAEVLGLAVLFGREIDLAELGDAVDQVGNF